MILCPHAPHGPPGTRELPPEEEDEGTTDVCSTVGLASSGDAAEEAVDSDSVLPEGPLEVLADFRLPFDLLPEEEAVPDAAPEALEF